MLSASLRINSEYYNFKYIINGNPNVTSLYSFDLLTKSSSNLCDAFPAMR